MFNKLLFKYCVISGTLFVLYQFIIQTLFLSNLSPEVRFTLSNITTLVCQVTLMFYLIRDNKQYNYWKVLGGLAILLLVPYFLSYLISIIKWIFTNILFLSDTLGAPIESLMTQNTMPVFRPIHYLTYFPSPAELNNILVNFDLPILLKLSFAFSIFFKVIVIYFLYVISRMTILKSFGINKWWALLPVVSNYLLLDRLRMYSYFKTFYGLNILIQIACAIFLNKIPLLFWLPITFFSLYIYYSIYRTLCQTYKVSTYNALGLLLLPFLFQFQIKYYIDNPDKIGETSKPRSIYFYTAKYIVVLYIVQTIFDQFFYNPISLRLIPAFILLILTIIVAYFLNKETRHDYAYKRFLAILILFAILFISCYDKYIEKII